MDNIDSRSESYKKAGVDVTAGYEAVRLIKPLVESTYTKGVIGSIGGFGGLFAPDFSGMSEPVLISGADGVGTKLRLAFSMDKHDTIGIDSVAMCVNDIICAGAKPLFFLDYLATGKLDPNVAAQIVSGVAEGCRQAGCALVGGETAEMPGFYADGEYDLAGFAVGLVDRAKIIDSGKIRAGDTVIALASSGMHSNGFSLARKVLGDDKESLSEAFSCCRTVGAELLTPTKIYVRAISALQNAVDIHGISNITGGGWYENIPRMLPGGIRAVLRKDALPVPAIFNLIMKRGDIPQRDMYNTFNMGAGMFVAVAPQDAAKALAALESAGERAAVIGECVAGERGIEIC